MTNALMILLGLFLLALLWGLGKAVIGIIECMLEDMGKIFSSLGSMVWYLIADTYRLSAKAYARIRR